MALYAISDLHLALNTDKPMDIFGEKWRNHHEKIKENWNNGNVFINMSIVNLIFMALATYNWIFARFNMYFALYNVVLIPYIIKCIPNVKEKRLIYYTAVICYAVCYYLDGLQSNYYTPYINI